MTDRDIRQKSYSRCKKHFGRMILLCLLIVAFFGPVAYTAWDAISFGWIFMACIFAIAGWLFVYSLRLFRERRDLVLFGLLFEAEVTDLKSKIDSNDGKEYLSEFTCEITLPGGKKRSLKKEANGLSELLGLVKLGIKLPVFVDRRNPDVYFIETRLLSDDLFQHKDATLNHIQWLKDKGADLGNIPDMILYAPQKRSFRQRLSWWFSWLAVGVIAAGFVGGVIYGLVLSVRSSLDVRHEDIDLPAGWYISAVYKADVYEYSPETNKWSYTYDNMLSPSSTEHWRYDSKCRVPLRIEYTSLGNAFSAGTLPSLLVPQSYHNRLHEFVHDKKADLRQEMYDLLKDFSPRTGVCAISPFTRDTLRIHAGDAWPMSALTPLCAAKAAEIRLKAQGVNLDTLRFGAGNNSFVIVCNHAISRIAKSAIDTLEHLAGGVENIGSALATDGIGGFELVSMRDTFANRTTPLAMATLLDRMKPYSYFIYDIPSDICEKDYLYEALGNHTIDFSYLLACRQEQGRRVLNVFAEKRNREGSVAIFMEGEAFVSEKEMQQKAGALLQLIVRYL